MFTRDDLIDAVLRGLAAGGETPSQPKPPGGAVFPITARGRGRPFLTEHDIKKALTPGARVLTIPRDAIVSPLVSDWLTLKGVVLVRSDR